jgi:integration host factor subunit alpha
LELLISGRNPKTGEVIPVTARRVVTFHPSSVLKVAVVAAGVVKEKMAA